MKKLLIPVLMAFPLVPLAGQSGGETGLFWQTLRRSSHPFIVVFEDGSTPMTASVRQLLQEEGVADLNLVPWTLAEGMRELATDIQRRFGLAQGTRWAVLDSSEQCLASGAVLPSADEMTQQLAAKGLQSPIRALREFLKERPDHLEAQIGLLRSQLKNAERRTRTTLDLEVEDRDSQLVGAMGQGGQRMVMRVAGLDDLFGRPKQKPVPRDKVLDAETDLKIWAGYAETFDSLFSGDDWIAGGWGFDGNDAALETCSPLVKALYKRKLKQVEAALELAPANTRLWSVWLRMAEVVGGHSIRAVVENLVQQPGGNFSSWPANVRSGLIDEARAGSKWDYIVDYLWSEYESGRSAPRIEFGFGSNVNFTEGTRRFMDDIHTREWDTVFEPLLEALINMDDLGRADAIVNTLRERQQQGQLTEALMQRAIALANGCGRPDLARRWSVFLLAKDTVE